jgi:hypothetical protein
MDKWGLHISRCSLALSLAVKFGLVAWAALVLFGGPTGSAALTPPAQQALKTASAVEATQYRRKKRRVRSARRHRQPPQETVAEEPAPTKEPAQTAKSKGKDAPAVASQTADPKAAKDAEAGKAHPNGKDSKADAIPSEAEAKEQVWTDAQIIAALEECLQLLSPLGANIDVSKPMRNGQCGAPAPVTLKRVGAVEISPPAVMNCRMVASLHEWIETKLQPAARDLLKSPVTRMISASGYVCRNRYGSRDNSKISEHAFANALDISAFVTADGRTVDVLRHWGHTERDLHALALAKAEAEKQEKAAAAAEKTAVAAEKAAESATKAAEKSPKSKSRASAKEAKLAAAKEARERAQAALQDAERAEGLVKAEQAKLDAKDKGSKRAPVPEAKASRRPLVEDDIPAPQKAAPDVRGRQVVAANQRSNLGGGAPRGTLDARISEDSATTVEGRLLRRLHKGACGIFGTVLGPEANEAHRNHFHFDLAVRRRNAFCE